jgi:hypothetical protein
VGEGEREGLAVAAALSVPLAEGTLLALGVRAALREAAREALAAPAEALGAGALGEVLALGLSVRAEGGVAQKMPPAS